ncbi:MAG: hypothetical protein KDK37_06835 [Leptospiraceae bacterium]|nr:hypothetical protein [Leptospiraceae bacterium]
MRRKSRSVAPSWKTLVRRTSRTPLNLWPATLCVLLLLWGGFCSEASPRQTEPESMVSVSASGDSPEARQFQRVCSACHALPDPHQKSPENWGPVILRMEGHRRNKGFDPLSRSELRQIRDYLMERSKQ